MPHNKIYEDGVHFTTFSCYGRRRLLNTDQAKRIVLGVLGSQLAAQSGRCVGFVIMPNHVHALVWFTRQGQSSEFMKVWKQRSSVLIKQYLLRFLPQYAQTFPADDPVWQRRSYDFNVVTEKKVLEKLEYIHNNPVKAGLVTEPCEWPFSSARFYLQGKSVGLPVGMQ
ncbi:MAG TPA: transposase [Planctomycetota bacterium]|nr:transposase [Planctomycetota bacterium]